MKMPAAALLLGLIHLAAPTQASPILKVLQMITDLQAKIITEGEEAQKVYDEFAEACEDRSKDFGFTIKTLKTEIAESKSCIAEEASIGEASTAQLEECSAEATQVEKELKKATEIRKKENADFLAEEKEVMETIDTLERAIAILDREMAKSPAMLQVKSAAGLTKALTALVQAELLSSADADRLTAITQTSSDDADESPEESLLETSETGAPDPAAYKGHSSNIIETLEALLDKAKAQLDSARKQETASLNTFEMLELALKDKIKAAEKCVAKSKASIAESSEKKAVCEGDLAEATKSLEVAVSDLADLHQDCMETATNFEMETTSRGEELKALAVAKKIIKESTEGVTTYDLNQVSFLQTHSKMVTARFAAVKFLRDLARKHKSAALAQLITHISSVLENSDRTGADPFGKVKGLISAMIEKLMAEAEAEASHKAYCDKEMAYNKEKKEDKTEEIEKLTATIDEKAATSLKLKDEVVALQKQLTALIAHQAEMDMLREKENTLFVAAKKELDEGIEGVKLALKVLREYYAQPDKAHVAAEGASSGIVGLLEVIEGDFTKGLAEAVAAEESAQADYVKETKENEVFKVTLEQDIKYKTKEAKDLDQAVAELTSDRSGVQTELDAIMEYQARLDDQCIAKAEPYEERKRRREAEIAGLKEAMTILEGQAVSLLQESAVRRLRGPPTSA